MHRRRSGISVLGALALTAGACAHGNVVATDRTVGSAAQLDPPHGEAAADGSWVVLSQADRVDAPLEHRPMTLHGPRSFEFKLLLDGYEGIPVDDYIASPDGRTLLVEQHGRYRLVDVKTSGWTDLGPAYYEEFYDHFADPRPPLPVGDRTDVYNGHGTCYAGFSADGRTALVLDESATGHRLVVHALDDGLRHEIDPGPGVLSWARLMPAGDAVVVRMTVEGPGTNAEQPNWRFPLSETIRCPEPSTLSEGTVTVTRVLALDGHELGRRLDEYQPMGPGLIRPTEDGGFWWWRPDLDEETRTPACEGHLIHVDPAVPRILALCDEQEVVDEGRRFVLPGRLRLEMLDERVELGPVKWEPGESKVDHSQRFVALQTGEGPLVVDLDERRTIQLPLGGQVMAIAAGRVLVQNARIRLRPRPMRVRIVELESLATLETFWADAASWMSATGSGTTLVYGKRVIDMKAAQVLGRLPSRPLEVTEEGRALLFDPETRQPRGDMLPRGPLRWFEASAR